MALTVYPNDPPSAQLGPAQLSEMAGLKLGALPEPIAELGALLDRLRGELGTVALDALAHGIIQEGSRYSDAVLKQSTVRSAEHFLARAADAKAPVQLFEAACAERAALIGVRLGDEQAFLRIRADQSPPFQLSYARGTGGAYKNLQTVSPSDAQRILEGMQKVPIHPADEADLQLAISRGLELARQA